MSREREREREYMYWTHHQQVSHFPLTASKMFFSGGWSVWRDFISPKTDAIRCGWEAPPICASVCVCVCAWNLMYCVLMCLLNSRCSYSANTGRLIIGRTKARMKKPIRMWTMRQIWSNGEQRLLIDVCTVDNNWHMLLVYLLMDAANDGGGFARCG